MEPEELLDETDETISMLVDQIQKLRQTNRLWMMVAVAALLYGVTVTIWAGGLLTANWFRLSF